MTAYLDSSVLLRIVLGQPGHLKEWRTVRRGVASAIVEVECLRTLDRIRLRSAVPDVDVARRREAVFRILETIEIVDATRTVLTRASQPLPTDLGSLDAIHLATAMVWREENMDTDLVLATHDAALGIAARSCGFRVIGVA